VGVEAMLGNIFGDCDNKKYILALKLLNVALFKFELADDKYLRTGQLKTVRVDTHAN
ncbi:hypothetical protein ACJX0J_006789, partial [Zea mays]